MAEQEILRFAQDDSGADQDDSGADQDDSGADSEKALRRRNWYLTEGLH